MSASFSSQTLPKKLSKKERTELYEARRAAKKEAEQELTEEVRELLKLEAQRTLKKERDIAENEAARKAVYDEYARAYKEKFPNDAALHYRCKHSGQHSRSNGGFVCGCGANTTYMWVRRGTWQIVYDQYAVPNPHSIRPDLLSELYERSIRLQDEFFRIATKD